MLVVGLRHDIDNTYGLRKGLSKIISVESKLDIRSTFFVRADVIKSEKDMEILRRIEDDGWEIGLHLINTVGSPDLPSPEEELKVLRRLNAPIYGVTPCGKTIGFRGEVTWRVMDSLGLDYMEGYGKPDFPVRTFVMPTHLSFDIHYVRKFGEEEGYRRFKEDLLKELERNKVATVLVHPEWFVRSVGGKGLTKIPLTLLRIKMMNRVYERFLSDFRDKIKFKKYVDIYRLLRGEEK
ncbi:MAG: hypothetical protein ACUX7D_01410 [Candidatus Methanodesulfokora washburnensis]|jgi:peptidoglycan/xylan/chitin deacetylase (PgdA/CDA1 family)